MAADHIPLAHPVSLSEHYTSLRNLLASWSELWGHSIFDRFAEMERLIPEPWFHYGATTELAAQFEAAHNGSGGGGVPDSFLNLIHAIRNLCALPPVGEVQALNPSLADGLTPKKKHEIEAVLSFLRKPGTSVSRILDVGGGAGHLARHLAHELGCPVESIDRDSAVQKKGLRIMERRPWRGILKHPVHFVSADFSGAGSRPPATDEGAWSIGLHTCGDMAWSHLKLIEKRYSILNFGCCYEKLDVSTGTQRSRLARLEPLPLTAEALFLANRSGPKSSAGEFFFQQRVQRYRLSLYELLSREGCSSAQCGAVGSASAAAYSGPFSGYVRDRLQHLEGLPDSALRLSDAACEDFYRSIEALIERKRFTAFIRGLFARPLEIAILLDRALFIEEHPVIKQGQVRLIQFFDPTISPRNIGLITQLTKT